MKNKILISLAFGGAISAAALYLAFRNVPLSDLVRYLAAINYWWLAPAIVLIVLTFVLRVIRWQIILRSSQAIPFWQAFHPLMIGFMMNCILPGRLGEIARPVLLKNQSQIPMTTGLATVVAERLFDIVLLIALFGAVFSAIAEKPDLQVQFGDYILSSKTLQTIAAGLIRLSLALLLIMVLIIIPFVRNTLTRLLLAFSNLPIFTKTKIQPIITKISKAGIQIMENFSQGLALVVQPWRLTSCIILTVMIWVLTVLIYFTISLGCPGIELTMWQWTTVMVIVCFFIALPSVPGFWGLWEAGGVFGLSLFGIGTKEAVGFTLVSHSIQLFPVILIGLLSTFITSVNIFKVHYDNKALEPIV
jgi:uncharacterized protein (TIRG00374 family)